jgi:Protein kinase domain
MTSEPQQTLHACKATPARSKFKPLRRIEGIVVVGCCIEVYSIPVLDSFEITILISNTSSTMSDGPGFKAVSSRKSSVGSSRKSTASVPPIDSFDGGILAALSIQDEEENIEISRSRSSVKSKRTMGIVSRTNDMKTVDVSKAIPSDSAKENSCTPKTQTNKVHNRNAPKIRVGKSPFVDVSRSIVFSEDEEDDDDIDSAESSSENDEDNSSDAGVLENEAEDVDEESDVLVDDEIASEVENDDVMTDFESENNEEEESDYESEYDPNGDSEIELSEGSSDQEDSEDLSFDPDADEIRPAVLQKLGQAEVTKSEILESTPMASKKMKPHRSEVKKTKATTDKSIKIKTTKEAARNQPTTGRCVDVENNLVNDSCSPVSSLSISREQIPEAIGVSTAESSDRNKSDSTVIVEADVDEEADDDDEYDEIVAEIVYSDDEDDDPINGDSDRNDGSICAVLNMSSSMKSTSNIVEHSSSEQSEVKGPPTEPTKLKDDSVCRNPVALPTSPKQLEQLNDDSLPQDAATIEKKENCGVAFNHECDEPVILNRSDNVNGDALDRSSSSSYIGEIDIPCDKGIAGTVILNLSMDAERKKPASRTQHSTKSRSRVLRREGSVKPGKWKLGAKIGAGAFGVVHIGMNTCTGTLMAVKSIKMEANSMKDAEREIQLMKTLHHENIVRYLGAERDAKYLHIFQEWVPAGSVTIMLSKFGPFPVTVVQSYLMQVLQGLNYLHSNHILHRDIKGSNILVNDDGIVKLADFGASKRFVQLKQDMMMSLTMRGSMYSVS